MKVVIGTRHWLGPDWTHVDGDSSPLTGPDGRQHPVDVISDAATIDLPDGCAELVYSQECLEHFPWGTYFDVLTEWSRLVAVGGKLRIEVPDFLAACNQVLSTDTLDMDRRIQQIIFGGQINQFDFHYSGHTHRTLPDDFARLGYEVTDVKRGFEHGWLLCEGIKRAATD